MPGEVQRHLFVACLHTLELICKVFSLGLRDVLKDDCVSILAGYEVLEGLAFAC